MYQIVFIYLTQKLILRTSKKSFNVKFLKSINLSFNTICKFSGQNFTTQKRPVSHIHDDDENRTT